MLNGLMLALLAKWNHVGKYIDYEWASRSIQLERDPALVHPHLGDQTLDNLRFC